MAFQEFLFKPLWDTNFDTPLQAMSVTLPRRERDVTSPLPLPLPVLWPLPLLWSLLWSYYDRYRYRYRYYDRYRYRYRYYDRYYDRYIYCDINIIFSQITLKNFNFKSNQIY